VSSQPVSRIKHLALCMNWPAVFRYSDHIGQSVTTAFFVLITH
jgi:hypothetical protein